VLASDALILEGRTAATMDEFRECFMAIQEQRSRPVWFVPHDDGGRLSNAGAAGVQNPYVIRYSQQSGTNRVAVFLDHRGSEEMQVSEVVRTCW
jgi:hypothetical protein